MQKKQRSFTLIRLAVVSAPNRNYPNRGWLFETSVTVLLLNHDVQAFTMFPILIGTFGYYALGWLLLNHPTSCLAGRHHDSEWVATFVRVSRFPSGLIAAIATDRPGLYIPESQLVFPKRSASHVKQISPDKDMNFRATTASFTVSVESQGFVTMC